MTTKVTIDKRHKAECPFCNCEITGEDLIEGHVEPKKEFFCPNCETVLFYTLIIQMPTTQMFLHVAPIDQNQDLPAYERDLILEQIKPIKLPKTILIRKARAYFKVDVHTKSGKVIPAGTPCTILNVEDPADEAEIKFDDPNLVARPTVKIAKHKLLLDINEIGFDEGIDSLIDLLDKNLEFRSIIRANKVRQILKPLTTSYVYEAEVIG